jgi:hypothetical protein
MGRRRHSGKAEAVQLTSVAELVKLHPKIGNFARSMSLERRRLMIDRAHGRLSIPRHCKAGLDQPVSFYY